MSDFGIRVKSAVLDQPVIGLGSNWLETAREDSGGPFLHLDCPWLQPRPEGVLEGSNGWSMLSRSNKNGAKTVSKHGC